MIRITHLETLPGARLRLRFDDGTTKEVDMSALLGDDPLTGALRDPAYFQQARLYDNGRGVYWPNDYDLCPDWLRYHAPVADTQNSELVAATRD